MNYKRKLHANRSPGPENFTGEVNKTFKEKLIPVSLNPRGRNASKIILLEHHHMLIPKPHHAHTHTHKNYRSIFLMNIDAEIFNKILVN